MTKTATKAMLAVKHCKEMHGRLGGLGVVMIQFHADGRFGVAEWGATRRECKALKTFVDEVAELLNDGVLHDPFADNVGRGSSSPLPADSPRNGGSSSPTAGAPPALTLAPPVPRLAPPTPWQTPNSMREPVPEPDLFAPAEQKAADA